METLEKQLTEGIVRYKRWGENNQRAAFLAFVAATLAIVAATVLAAFDVSKVVRAVVTALPGVVVLVNSIFRFEAKSRWHWEKTRGYEELLRALTYENVSQEEISRRLTKLEHRMDEKWIWFGNLPTTPVKGAGT